MFDEETKASTKKFFNWQLILFIVLALIGLSAVAFGFYSLTSFSSQSYFSEEIAPEASKSASISLFQGFIYVDLAGAVKNPGIYQLVVGSRLAAAINQAGGFTTQADSKYVSQELNLAQKLKDGDKIYIPSQEEKDYQQTSAEFCQSLNDASSQAGSDGLVQISVNNATASDLQTLEGIGEKRAEEILAGRPYQSLGELVEKEVLTESLFGKIKNQLKL
jgi:competence protein ComEA